MSSRLKTDFAGISFKNPIVLASGTCGFGKEINEYFDIQRLGGISSKGLTLNYRAGNDGIRIWETPAGIMNSVGLENPGVRAFLENENPRMNKLDLVNIVNLGGHSVEDYIEAVELINEHDIDILELNISCPNVCDDQLFSQPAQFRLLAQAITARGYNLPVTIKMPLTHSDTQFDDLLAIASQHAIDGLTIANLEKDRQRVHLHDELPPRVPGGLSGAVTYQRSNQLIARARSLYGQRFFIIGVGGIFSPADARAKLAAGADAVALITGMMFTGPQLMASIVADIPPTTPVTPTESHPQSPRHIKSQKKS